MYKHVSILLAFSLALAVSAGHGKSVDREQPADINAGRYLEDPEAGTRTFRDNVVLTQGSLEVHADEANVGLDDESNLTRVILTGAPVRWNEELDNGQTLNAQARRIDYEFTTEEVTLTGGVVILRGGDEISGDRVHYDMKNSRLDAGGDVGGRIKMRITPQKNAAENSQDSPVEGESTDGP